MALCKEGSIMTLDQTIQTWLGIVTVFAVIAGPILALYIQNRLNIGRENRDRKMWVFKTLMATRAHRLSPEHVTALNMLDVECYGDARENRDVIRSWNTYRDHLNSGPSDPKDPKYLEKSVDWDKDGLKLFHQ